MKLRCKYRCLTQTQLGLLFGASSHAVGRWLVVAGLRDGKTKKPTTQAHRGGFCETAPSGPAGYHWVWDAEKTVAALLAAGHPLAESVPDDLVEPPALTGPFMVGTPDETTVRNDSGQVVVRATSGPNARLLAKLLNAAHRSGTLDRLLHTPAANENHPV